MIRPHPPRFLIKRRKTVSVTPAMGASTVAGAISTLPIFRVAGTPRAGPAVSSGAKGASPVRVTAASVLSQNFCTPLFYVLSNACRKARIHDFHDSLRDVLLAPTRGIQTNRM